MLAVIQADIHSCGSGVSEVRPAKIHTPLVGRQMWSPLNISVMQSYETEDWVWTTRVSLDSFYLLRECCIWPIFLQKYCMADHWHMVAQRSWPLSQLSSRYPIGKPVRITFRLISRWRLQGVKYSKAMGLGANVQFHVALVCNMNIVSARMYLKSFGHVWSCYSSLRYFDKLLGENNSRKIESHATD